ncbi:hypothetical protein PPERSA_02506 [Pseudocohnilembus persalinus]|uniref:Uncharacterized protein n=1 Tax=Pseudocohnilembus persalinus TaxID=266149 RepID=A0A0V0QB31_PSEPJ|nr:hypothetical protein PPERSA_02506 [Pseudocohnilembus persalinus]|eukprot:KRW99394.1 hypothetical protein PPERSA_02506 [Pseudocohnilembus persalinus]
MENFEKNVKFSDYFKNTVFQEIQKGQGFYNHVISLNGIEEEKENQKQNQKGQDQNLYKQSDFDKEKTEVFQLFNNLKLKKIENLDLNLIFQIYGQFNENITVFSCQDEQFIFQNLGKNLFDRIIILFIAGDMEMDVIKGGKEISSSTDSIESLVKPGFYQEEILDGEKIITNKIDQIKKIKQFLENQNYDLNAEIKSHQIPLQKILQNIMIFKDFGANRKSKKVEDWELFGVLRKLVQLLQENVIFIQENIDLETYIKSKQKEISSDMKENFQQNQEKAIKYDDNYKNNISCEPKISFILPYLHECNLKELYEIIVQNEYFGQKCAYFEKSNKNQQNQNEEQNDLETYLEKFIRQLELNEKSKSENEKQKSEIQNDNHTQFNQEQQQELENDKIKRNQKDIEKLKKEQQKLVYDNSFYDYVKNDKLQNKEQVQNQKIEQNLKNEKKAEIQENEEKIDFYQKFGLVCVNSVVDIIKLGAQIKKEEKEDELKKFQEKSKFDKQNQSKSYLNQKQSVNNLKRILQNNEYENKQQNAGYYQKSGNQSENQIIQQDYQEDLFQFQDLQNFYQIQQSGLIYFSFLKVPEKYELVFDYQENQETQNQQQFQQEKIDQIFEFQISVINLSLKKLEEFYFDNKGKKFQKTIEIKNYEDIQNITNENTNTNNFDKNNIINNLNGTNQAYTEVLYRVNLKNENFKKHIIQKRVIFSPLQNKEQYLVSLNTSSFIFSKGEIMNLKIQHGQNFDCNFWVQNLNENENQENQQIQQIQQNQENQQIQQNKENQDDMKINQNNEVKNLKLEGECFGFLMENQEKEESGILVFQERKNSVQNQLQRKKKKFLSFFSESVKLLGKKYKSDVQNYLNKKEFKSDTFNYIFKYNKNLKIPEFEKEKQFQDLAVLSPLSSLNSLPLSEDEEENMKIDENQEKKSQIHAVQGFVIEKLNDFNPNINQQFDKICENEGDFQNLKTNKQKLDQFIKQQWVKYDKEVEIMQQGQQKRIDPYIQKQIEDRFRLKQPQNDRQNPEGKLINLKEQIQKIIQNYDQQIKNEVDIEKTLQKNQNEKKRINYSKSQVDFKSWCIDKNYNEDNKNLQGEIQNSDINKNLFEFDIIINKSFVKEFENSQKKNQESKFEKEFEETQSIGEIGNLNQEKQNEQQKIDPLCLSNKKRSNSSPVGKRIINLNTFDKNKKRNLKIQQVENNQQIIQGLDVQQINSQNLENYQQILEDFDQKCPNFIGVKLCLQKIYKKSEKFEKEQSILLHSLQVLQQNKKHQNWKQSAIYEKLWILLAQGFQNQFKFKEAKQCFRIFLCLVQKKIQSLSLKCQEQQNIIEKLEDQKLFVFKQIKILNIQQRFLGQLKKKYQDKIILRYGEQLGKQYLNLLFEYGMNQVLLSKDLDKNEKSLHKSQNKEYKNTNQENQYDIETINQIDKALQKFMDYHKNYNDKIQLVNTQYGPLYQIQNNLVEKNENLIQDHNVQILKKIDIINKLQDSYTNIQEKNHEISKEKLQKTFQEVFHELDFQNYIQKNMDKNQVIQDIDRILNLVNKDMNVKNFSECLNNNLKKKLQFLTNLKVKTNFMKFQM